MVLAVVACGTSGSDRGAFDTDGGGGANGANREGGVTPVAASQDGGAAASSEGGGGSPGVGYAPGSCSPLTCKDGCCKAGTCNPNGKTQDSACGHSGAVCTDCTSSNQTCDGNGSCR